ncbi:BZ3500_MvSof-1268-A1-R1_Chr3-1g05647 [Microbotryum saponariae]|uniref:BZ3500_MvSof-1268-A1-R1_Chr3-1g05647 protein n=1 Tax=Microbotryum saponariae TaxID=289078 RepID=A0A2X0NI19_9BASI|nr:BZ3500_MvSof-1268-A1-R1_Chr3-1g05647 [Microbotryum saponariae]SDA04837.1 BZ3501_MvSof-1269-A2-R1_Chr3-1g05317 [Microbotryum saponariae]
MPPAQDPTQSLLRWGIENAAPNSLLPLHEDIQAGRRPDLNTDILKAIMGTTDADRMRECLMVIEGKWVDRDGTGKAQGVAKENAEVTAEDRYRAWDDLEMVTFSLSLSLSSSHLSRRTSQSKLIEDIDNANDMQNLGLWKPIVAHLTDDDTDVVMRACWVCGTAVQNNPKAQQAFLALDPLPTITSIITSASTPIGTRNKAMYCLSSTLKHSAPAVARFSELQGWNTLTQSLQDPSQVMRTKAAFLLSQLVSQSSSPKEMISSLRTSNTLSTLLASLFKSSATPTGPDGDSAEIDADYRDKVLRFFVNAIERDADALQKEEKEQVVKAVREAEGEGWKGQEDLGMSEEEWNAFVESLSE